METEIAKFNVVSKDGETTWETEVHHDFDGEYELFSITQTTGEGEFVTVLLHRDQLAALSAFVKGH